MLALKRRPVLLNVRCGGEEGAEFHDDEDGRFGRVPALSTRDFNHIKTSFECILSRLMVLADYCSTRETCSKIGR
jgi:hypothetical protein